MLKAAKISIAKTKKQIFFFGMLNCAVYIILFMSFNYFNLLYISGLRMLNYVTLFLIALYQINHLTKQLGAYIPSLQAFLIIFLTGAFSCMLLGGFIFIYSLFNPSIPELYFNTYGKLNSLSAVFIFFEGLASSTIIGLVVMMYSDRYEDGEAEIN